ncbi:3-oxo-5-alpha-steroid 4-dehydrogenase family protein [Niveomyces insectorum RCEF 264]|uniref:3-oxo-5-alpha-steroid 4-dehydrogenase family protein n=1 Tax=Niveomyces insectorum RCEF 264 TaxID=1081102 RepID=A0A167NQQ7_9HYPO|nr:3-oxo-5-alpha-steroid 4-dehydrogenase family protein [Niveomyces insectorum RCEF 264]
MALIEGWLPPNREHYDLLVRLWQFYPLVASLQWPIKWYGMGKTSVNSVLNLPGRIGWLTMESPGFLTLLYVMRTLTEQEGITDLPWQNKFLAGLFVIHYCYRAVLFPLIAPSMSPLHGAVWLMGVNFQLCNAICLGGWLAAYGPRTAADWSAQLGSWPTVQFVAGVAVFFLGLAANYYHDDVLRAIRWREKERRAVAARQAKKDGGRTTDGNGASAASVSPPRVPAVDKHYQLPEAGLFRYMLYPHYFVEWVEWTGFYMAAGWSCVPARMFVVNEIAAMLPRAVRGRAWYIERFGAEKVGSRWTIIPGVL